MRRALIATFQYPFALIRHPLVLIQYPFALSPSTLLRTGPSKGDESAHR